MAKEGNDNYVKKALKSLRQGALGVVGGVEGVVKDLVDYDSTQFKNSFIDRIKASNQARNEGVKVNKTLTRKGGSFMDRVRNR